MKNRKLLIVDSDPKNRRILKNCFVDADYIVDEAADDKDAIDKLTETVYDGILTELTIANIDGLKILEHLQRNSPTGTAVFFLTQKNDVWNRVKSFKLGAKDFIVKPVHVREIAARVQMILSRQERRREHQNRHLTFSGRLEDLTLCEIVEVLGIEKKTGILHLYNENNLSGRVIFNEGAVTSAATATLQAEEAVYKMMSWRKGRFSMRFTSVDVADEIGVSNMGLLLQGAKRMEQREELLKQLPSLDAVLVTTSNFKKIISQKNLATGLDYFISLFDGQRSLGRIVDESTYDEITTLSRIVKLYQLGFLNTLRDYSDQPANATTPQEPERQPQHPEPVMNSDPPEEETWPEETTEKVVSTFQNEALDNLETASPEITPEADTFSVNLDEETELAVQHDFANDGISELLTKDFSKWGSDSGLEKDLFYELRSAAEKTPAFHTAPSSQEPRDDSQLLFPTLEMLEQEHPADALLTLPTEHPFTQEEKPEVLSPPKKNRTEEAPPRPLWLVDRNKEKTPDRFKKAYGHVLVLGYGDEIRGRMVASLTANQVHIKEYDNPDWSNLFYGTSEFKGGHSLNIISVSIAKEFAGLVEYFSKSLFGYLLLIDTIPMDWNYYRYIIKALQQTLVLPSMILVPASISLTANLSEHDWRQILGLADHQILTTHVEFDPITCKRFIFRLFENYYREQMVLQKNNSLKTVTV
jgi:DNA-binding response OmpR family regulator